MRRGKESKSVIVHETTTLLAWNRTILSASRTYTRQTANPSIRRDASGYDHGSGEMHTAGSLSDSHHVVILGKIKHPYYSLYGQVQQRGCPLKGISSSEGSSLEQFKYVEGTLGHKQARRAARRKASMVGHPRTRSTQTKNTQKSPPVWRFFSSSARKYRAKYREMRAPTRTRSNRLH